MAVKIDYRRKHNVFVSCVHVELERKRGALPTVAAGTVQGEAGIEDAITRRRRRIRRMIRSKRAGTRRCIGQGGRTIRLPWVAWVEVLSVG